MLSSFLVLLFAAVGEFNVMPASGPTFSARWIGVNGSDLVFESNSGRKSISMDEMRRMEHTEKTALSSKVTQVGLADGTVLRVASVEMDDRNIRVQLPTPKGYKSLELNIKSVHWIRFRRPSPGVDPKWSEQLRAAQRSDLMVVRREGDAIDAVDGTVLAIADRSVAFNFSGQEVKAPQEKLEGLVFRHDNTPRAKPTVRIHDRYGSVWHAASFSSADGNVSWSTIGDVKHDLPIKAIESLHFDSSVVFLASQLKADSGEQANRSFKMSFGLKLKPEYVERLGPTSVDNDVFMRGNSRIEFRLPPDYASFETTVSTAAVQGGDTQLVISLDGKVALDETYNVVDKPLPVSLDIENARRLVIETRSTADGEAGDLLRLAEPRLKKKKTKE